MFQSMLRVSGTRDLWQPGGHALAHHHSTHVHKAPTYYSCLNAALLTTFCCCCCCCCCFIVFIAYFCQAAGALSGLAATVLFHPLQRWLGLPLAGFAGVTWQLVSLLTGVTPVLLSHWGQQQVMGTAAAAAAPAAGVRAASVLAHDVLQNSTAVAAAAAAGNTSIPGLANVTAAAGSSTSSIAVAVAGAASAGDSLLLLYVLLAGLVSSRLGLWLFDLAVTQLQQELVPGNQLGERHSSQPVFSAVLWRQPGLRISEPCIQMCLVAAAEVQWPVAN
jgi:hypothetical protein